MPGTLHSACCSRVTRGMPTGNSPLVWSCAPFLAQKPRQTSPWAQLVHWWVSKGHPYTWTAMAIWSSTESVWIDSIIRHRWQHGWCCSTSVTPLFYSQIGGQSTEDWPCGFSNEDLTCGRMAITVYHVECIHLYGNQQADVLNCTHLLEDVTTWLHKMMVHQRHTITTPTWVEGTCWLHQALPLLMAAIMLWHVLAPIWGPTLPSGYRYIVYRKDSYCLCHTIFQQVSIQLNRPGNGNWVHGGLGFQPYVV